MTKNVFDCLIDISSDFLQIKSYLEPQNFQGEPLFLYECHFSWNFRSKKRLTSLEALDVSLITFCL